MKPVELEDSIINFEKWYGGDVSIAEFEKLKSHINKVEKKLKNIDDEKETRQLKILLSILLFTTTVYLSFRNFNWVFTVFILWVVLLIFDRTKQRSLAVETLTQRSKIDPFKLDTKISYLLSGIRQKSHRLRSIKLLNFIFWPIFILCINIIIFPSLAYHYFVFLFLAINVINYIFWTYYYKNVIQFLHKLASNLENTLTRLIATESSMGNHNLTEEE